MKERDAAGKNRRDKEIFRSSSDSLHLSVLMGSSICSLLINTAYQNYWPARRCTENQPVTKMAILQKEIAAFSIRS